MGVCRFFLNGNCRFGDKCRNEHPAVLPAQQQQQPQGQNRNNNNNYAPRQPPPQKNGLFDRVTNGPAPQNNRQPQNGRLNSRDPRDTKLQEYNKITVLSVTDDMLNERPLWVMSAYGPGKDSEIQVFGGDLIEQSPEEIRTLYYQAMATNNVPQYAQYEAELAARSNQQVQMVAGDPSGALQYLKDGRNQHPNRQDICKGSTTHTAIDGEFSWTRRQQALRDQRRNAPIQTIPQAAGFSGGFGANVPQPAPNAFQMPIVQPGFGNPGFQQPPILPPQNLGAFGQPMQPGFVQPQVPDPQPPFGNPGQQQGFSTFGQPPVVQIPPTSAPAAFGQPQIPQSQVPQTQGFGGTQPPTIVQSNTMSFGQPAQSQSAFDRPQAPLTSNVANGSGFGPGSNTMINGSAMNGNMSVESLPSASGDVSTYSTRDSRGRLLTWKGRPVKYMEGGIPCYELNGHPERIWFPDGPPKPSMANAMADVQYPESVLAEYKHLSEMGTFPNGLVPEVAPRLDMVRFDC